MTTSNLFIYIEKVSGHLTTLTMANIWFQPVLINQFWYGIQENLQQDKNCWVTQIKCIGLNITKIISWSPQLEKEGNFLIWDTSKTDKPIKSVNLNTLVGYDISWDGDVMFVSTMGLKTVALNTKNFEIIS